MVIKSKLIVPVVKWTANHTKMWSAKAVEDQDKIMMRLVTKAQNTKFGLHHGFSNIKSYNVHKKQMPIRNYEELRPSVDRVVNGKSDILWLGKPKCFDKTSGTTSGVKYIPLTADTDQSTPYHKVPLLSNDREIADQLNKYTER